MEYREEKKSVFFIVKNDSNEENAFERRISNAVQIGIQTKKQSRRIKKIVFIFIQLNNKAIVYLYYLIGIKMNA